MGSGTMAEALAWVEYCNWHGNTAWATLRRANGRDEPYGVRYWALGNEMYGQLAGRHADRRGVRARGHQVRQGDQAHSTRRIQLVACGETGLTEWDRIVVDGLAGLVDYHSIHIYTGSDDYWTNVLQPHQAERAIRTSAALIERVRLRPAASTSRPRSPTTSGTSGTARGPEARRRAASTSGTRSTTPSRSPPT